MDKIYSVSCLYYIKSDSLENAEKFVSNEDDFIGKHITISEATNDECEDISIGLTELYNKEV